MTKSSRTRPGHRAAAGVIVTAISLAAGTATAPAADWPCWRGPDRNGISGEKGLDFASLKGGGDVLWTAEVGKGYSSVSVSRGRAFTMGSDGERERVIALDEATGRMLWDESWPRKPSGGYPGPRATPVTDGTNVYAIGQFGDVVALDAATGRTVWKANLEADLGTQLPTWQYSGSPVIHGPLLLVNAGDGGGALNRSNGRKAWASKPGVCGYATPVVFALDGRDLVAIFGEKALVVADAKTGAEYLRRPWETEYDINAADPVFDAGRLLASSGYRTGTSLLDVRRQPSRVLWESKALRAQFSSAVKIDGAVYGIDGNAGHGELVCLDLETGRERWRSGTGFGSLIAADGRLIVLNEKGELIVAAADPAAFREEARARVLKGGVAWTPPALANGRLYARNDGGALVCLRLGAIPAAGATSPHRPPTARPPSTRPPPGRPR